MEYTSTALECPDANDGVLDCRDRLTAVSIKIESRPELALGVNATLNCSGILLDGSASRLKLHEAEPLDDSSHNGDLRFEIPLHYLNDLSDNSKLHLTLLIDDVQAIGSAVFKVLTLMRPSEVLTPLSLLPLYFDSHTPTSFRVISSYNYPYIKFEVEYGLDDDWPNLIGEFESVSKANTITGLQPQTRYFVNVRVKINGGDDVNFREATTETQRAWELPDAPTGLSARPASYTVALTWEESALAQGYRVSYGLHPAGAVIDTVPFLTPAATISGLRSNTAYYFDLRAYNAAGDSGAVSTTATTLQVPAPPANVSATPGILTMDLTWSSSTGANSYIVQHGLEPGGAPQAVTVYSTSYQLTGLSRNTLYYVLVSAVNENGASLPTRITQKTLDGPPVPLRPGAIGSILITVDSLHVVWTGDTSNEFEVVYGLDDKYPEFIDKVTTRQNYLILKALPPDTLIFIEVRAFNASGYSDPSTTGLRTKFFNPPHSLALGEVTDESAAWSWSAGADYSSEVRYEVYVGDWYLDTVEDTHYLARGLTENTEYLFKVRAKVEGDYFSNYGTGSFLTKPYRGIRICAPDNLEGRRNSSTTALLSWDEPYAGCHLCPDVIGYQITGEGIEPLNAIGPPCEVKGLNAEREYRLTVRAKAGGNNMSQPVQVLIGRRPGSPGGLQAGSITQTSARLTWSAPDTQVPVFDYLIDCDGELIASIRGLAYELTDLEAGRSYVVGVRARTAASNVSDPVVKTFQTQETGDVTPPS